MTTITEFIRKQTGLLSETRRHLHRHPELSGSEIETTRFLAHTLSASDIPFRFGPDDRGIIVDLGNPDATQRIALRADIDALAIQDAKDAEYHSQVDSVMHACGHDAHATILLATVKALHDHFVEKHPSHAVRAIFQPEEESATGAVQMIDFGVLHDVTAIVGAHVDPLRPAGKVALRSGICTAHCNEVIVDIIGRSGHAARPAEAIDPIEIGADFINRCYQVVPRYTEEAKKLVLSFTSFHGGHQCNVIPDRVSILGTMRSLDHDARSSAIAGIHALAETVASETGCEIRFRLGHEVPSVVASPATTETVRAICRSSLGPENVLDIPEPSLGGEDFAFYTRLLPAAFVRLGCRGQEIGHMPLHNCNFDIDERVLEVGVNVMTHVGLHFFDAQ